MHRFASLVAGAVLALAATAAMAGPDDLARKIEGLSRSTQWQLVETIPVPFDTQHPQGFARVGDAIFVTSVEITVPTKRYPQPQDGYDRDTGQGVGHLFKLDAQGKLVGQITLGEGAIYHPGGIDYDGRWLWVPVAEYRPDSRSILYRVDPQTLEAVAVGRIADHVGGLVHDTDHQTLHGVSWGSRRFTTWHLDADGRVTDPEAKPTLNPEHYLDYQDCAYLPVGRAICTGITEFRRTPDAPVFGLGGIEIVDLAAGRPVFQVPVLLWTEDGTAITRNPVLVEETATGLRLTAMPEDDHSRILVYETTVP
ncbi:MULTISPECIES: DUF6454 family protein [unclassified Inquilinus]|uniref:DUF6454 family protein n=1 Tax=unclassified Inquilinus TaxID=2645927 RepID=UPI003F8E5910